MKNQTENMIDLKLKVSRDIQQLDRNVEERLKANKSLSDEAISGLRGGVETQV